MTPSCVTSRALRFAKRRGSHRSVAIVASTRGPSTKPVCAATNSNAPSVSSAKVMMRRADVNAEELPVARQPLEHDGVERLAGLGLDVEQQVAEQNSAGDEGQRHGHVDHRALAGLGARLAQDRQAVADRLDPGVRAAAQAVGAKENHRQRQHPDAVRAGVDLAHGVADD